MAKQLGIGDALPEFSLADQDGNTVARADLIGHGPTVLYFYPKDDTPGCTAEACSFRDSFESFTDAGARVVGVSSDSSERHRAFADRHRLPFTLLADVDNALRTAFRVKKTLGILPGRVTFIIDSGGNIRHAFSSQVNATRHVRESIAVLKTL